jgi:hypothetical protein
VEGPGCIRIVKRKVNSEPASRDLYLSSPALAWVRPSYHKILEAVKRWRITAASWGDSGDDKSVKKVIITRGADPQRVRLTICVTSKLTGAPP